MPLYLLRILQKCIMFEGSDIVVAAFLEDPSIMYLKNAYLKKKNQWDYNIHGGDSTAYIAGIYILDYSTVK